MQMLGFIPFSPTYRAEELRGIGQGNGIRMTGERLRNEIHQGKDG
jgi:hypothetical protein